MGISYIGNNGEYSSKFCVGTEMWGHITYNSNKYKHWKWGLIEASQGELLVADCYKNLAYMPISPTLAFAVGFYDEKISKEIVSEFNKVSIEKSSDFYFAKRLNLCPISNKIKILNMGTSL